MAPLSLSLQRQAEAEAEAEFEFEQERSSALGADYNRSVLGVAVEGVTEAPKGLAHFAKSVWDIGMPIDSFTFSGTGGLYDNVAKAGLEGTLDTTGSLAAGGAGAMALAPYGFAVGGPIGAGVAGGIGAGAGLLGYSFARDATDPTREIKPTDQYVKDLVYNTTQGAVTGPVAEYGMRLPGKALSIAKNPFGRAAAEGRVAKQLTTDGVTVQGIDDALAKDTGPLGIYKSLPELLDDPILKNRQRVLAGASPEGYGKATEATLARNDAQLRFLDEIETSPMTMDDVVTQVKEGVDNKLSRSQKEMIAAEDSVRESLETLPKTIQSDVAGDLLRKDLAIGEARRRGESSKLFPTDETGAINPLPVRELFDAELPNYFREVGANPDPALLALVEKFNAQASSSGLLDPTNVVKGKAQPFTEAPSFNLKDLQAARSDAIKIAENSDARSAALASKVIDGLDKAVDVATVEGKVSPTDVANWKEGIRLWKEKNIIYNSSATPAKAILAKDPFTGQYKLPASEVPSQIFYSGNKGAREAIRNYKYEHGATDAAMEPLHRYITEDFRIATTKIDPKTGSRVVNAKAAESWLRRHSDALDEMPELRRQLADVRTRQSFLDEKLGEFKATQADIEKGAASSILGKDVNKVIPSMLSGDNAIRKTTATVNYLNRNDPTSLGGLRRGVIDHFKQRATVPAEALGLEEALASGQQFKGRLLGGILVKELRAARPVLEKSGMFKKTQLDGLDYLYENKTSQLSIDSAKMVGGSDTFQNNAVLGALTKLSNNAFLYTFPKTRFLVSVIAPIIKKMTASEYLSVMEDALLNPRLARDLLQKATEKNITKVSQEIFKNQIAATGSQAIIAQGKQDGGSESQTPVAPPKPPSTQTPITTKSFPTPQDLRAPAGGIKKTSWSNNPETNARIQVESSGDPFALGPVTRSGERAEGLNQILPSTGWDIADAIDGKRDGVYAEPYTPLRKGMTPAQQRYSINQNIRFGDFYYQEQLKTFKNPTLARVAYNAGPGRVQNAIKAAKKTNPNPGIDEILARLPEGVKKESIPYNDKIRQIIQRTGAEV